MARGYLPLGWSSTLLLLLISFGSLAAQEIRFEDHFLPGALRIDYVRGGTATEMFVAVEAVREEPVWAGPRTGLVPSFDRGCYQVRVLDPQTGRVLYAYGYNTVFAEWQTIPEARTQRRVFRESITIPCPRRPVKLVFLARNRAQVLNEVHAIILDPESVTVRRDPPRRDVRRVSFLNHGPPAEKVDLVVLAEGYTAREQDRFEADARRLMSTFLARRPFVERSTDFNVTFVFAPSEESGIDEPAEKRFRRTAVEASFHAFQLPRYVLVEDFTRLEDVVAGTPCDARIVLVNSDRYGGGGIYNWFAIVAANNPWADFILAHEFGHSFAGLADEYYSSSVTYDDFYPSGTEPLAPNITRFAGAPDRGRSKLKWHDLVEDGTPLPTPWPQADYDRLVGRQKKQVAEARARGRSAEQVYALELELDQARQRFLADVAAPGRVGMFQGAGYVARGMYRPCLDCTMFSRSHVPYCPVCRRAIERMIDYWVGRPAGQGGDGSSRADRVQKEKK
jgi:IgA peptidase M64/peptidase M64-like protein